MESLIWVSRWLYALLTAGKMLNEATPQGQAQENWLKLHLVMHECMYKHGCAVPCMHRYKSVFVDTWDDALCASDGRVRVNICNFNIENTAIKKNPAWSLILGANEKVSTAKLDLATIGNLWAPSGFALFFRRTRGWFPAVSPDPGSKQNPRPRLVSPEHGARVNRALSAAASMS